MSETKNILVVDDNEHWLRTIDAILGSEYNLTLLDDYRKAIRLLKSNKFDLIILDKRLPGISGLDLLKEIRRMNSDLRAIMLTGYGDIDSAVESMKIGALDYIEKGTEDLSAELRARVAEALGREAYYKVGSDVRLDSDEIIDLIAKGESRDLEFKSSARWDIKGNKLNKELERVIVKTVAAFLNSEAGGVLLIGVGDDGTIIGLQQDYQTVGKKHDRDAYENFLTNILLDSYGKDSSPLIQIFFHLIDNKDICRIIVKPSPKPVFVKDDKGEHLFIRTGNSTRQLSTREAIEYCKIRW